MRYCNSHHGAVSAGKTGALSCFPGLHLLAFCELWTPGAISPLPSVPGTGQANSLLVYAVISGLICAQCAILGLKGERLHVYPLHTDAHGHPVLSPSPTPTPRMLFRSQWLVAILSLMSTTRRYVGGCTPGVWQRSRTLSTVTSPHSGTCSSGEIAPAR